METLILVAKGLVAKEIAHTLNISEKTVRNHISNIYRKLGIYDRSQLVIYAMKKGLVDLQDAYDISWNFIDLLYSIVYAWK